MAALMAGDSTSRPPRTDRRWIRFYSGQECSWLPGHFCRAIACRWRTRRTEGSDRRSRRNDGWRGRIRSTRNSDQRHCSPLRSPILPTVSTSVARTGHHGQKRLSPSCWAPVLASPGACHSAVRLVLAAAGAALLLLAEFTLLLSGTWLQFASLALFCLTGMAHSSGPDSPARTPNGTCRRAVRRCASEQRRTWRRTGSGFFGAPSAAHD